MKILSPYSRPLRNGKINPKNYPWFNEVIAATPWVDWVQIGAPGETRLEGVKEFHAGLSLEGLKSLVKTCEDGIAFLGVDNFFPHFMAAYYPHKRGVVIWGQSDPRHFGYQQNQNLSLGKYRERQWEWWENTEFDPSVFPRPEEVVRILELKWKT